MEYCDEHTKIVEGISEIREGQKSIINLLKRIEARLQTEVRRLDERINGSFGKMESHISEGDRWRERIIRLEMLVDKIAKEKLNSAKNAQYRISLLTSILTALGVTIIEIISRHIF